MNKNKIFKIGYYVFLGALGLVALTLLVSAFPVTGNYQFKIVKSGSMEPNIRTGSVVMVKPFDGYKIGDVITFNSKAKKDETITHRVVEMKVDAGNPIYITKGDANEEADTREIKQSEVIGRVLFSAPYLGYAVATAQQPWGFAVLIIVPAVLIIGDEVKKIWLEIKKKKNSNAQI